MLIKPRYFFVFTLLCVASIFISLFWIVTPHILTPRAPIILWQTASEPHYLLVDEGGQVCVQNVSIDGIQTTASHTDILVNLLPEREALRIKQGYRIAGQAELNAFLDYLYRVEL